MSMEIQSIELISADDNSSNQFSGKQWRLGPFDHLIPHIVPIATIFLYKNDGKMPQESILNFDTFRIAIRRVLSHYYHLTGRLKVNLLDETLEIDLNNAGMGLSSAECSGHLSDYTNDGGLSLKLLPGEGNSLLPPFSPTSETLSDYPLLTVQFTRFKCGSVCLGIRIFHCLCDAEGFFQLVHDIARHYDAALTDTAATATIEPPHLESVQFSEVLPTSYKPVMFKVNSPDESFLNEKSAISCPTVEVVGRMLHFSRERLDQIKISANTQSTGKNRNISTFVALTSYIYQRLYRARRQLAMVRGWPDLDAVSTDILTPINWRRTDRLSLPPRYFPNAVLTTTMSLSPEILAEAPLTVIAQSWNDRLGCMTPNDARQTLTWITAQPSKSCIVPEFRLQHGGFMISQWSNIPLYEKATMGGVVPAFIAPPFTSISTIDGLGYILPSPPHFTDGSLDIFLALDSELWALLDQDTDWM